MFDNGAVTCFGRNDFGQLGIGNTENIGDNPNELERNLPAINLGTGRTAKQISAGLSHTCAVLDNGSAKCWGKNTTGQLGQGHTRSIGDDPNEMGDNLPPINLGKGRTAKAIEAGQFHTCALLSNGDVKCWGRNTFGQLGLGHTETIGDGPNEMGDNLPIVNLATRAAIQLALGQEHTCALMKNNNVRCWGGNKSGQLGQGNSRSLGDEPGEMGINLTPVDLGTDRNAQQIVSGWEHVCALLDNTDIKCWGSSEHSQLGLDGPLNVGNRRNEMGDNLPVVNLGTSRLKLGDPGFGERDFRDGIEQLSAGRFHTCAILVSKQVKCWGSNSDGQLGAGDKIDRGGATEQMGDNLPVVPLGTHPLVTQIAAGGDHACVLRLDNSIVCWGRNRDGELGLGHTENLGDDPDDEIIAPPRRPIFSPTDATIRFR